MPPFQHDPDAPASREVSDTHAFLHEDKFDTWLDLSGLHEFQSRCSTVNHWGKENFKDLNYFISADTICLLNMTNTEVNEIVKSQITATLPAKILKYALTNSITKCHMKDSSVRTMINTIKTASHDAALVQLAHLVSHCSSSITEPNLMNIENWEHSFKKWSSSTHSAFLVSEDFMYALKAHKDLMNFVPRPTPRSRTAIRLRRRSPWVNLPSIKGRILVTHDIFMLVFGREHYLLDKTLFLECVNKSCELFCTLLYAEQQAARSMPANHVEFTRRIINHYVSEVTKYARQYSGMHKIERENKGFIYLKAIEGLGVSELIKRGDRLEWVNTSLQITLWDALKESGHVSQELFEDGELAQIWRDATCAQIAECLGLVKLAGHPSIEVRKGVKKLYDRTHEQINVQREAVTRSIAYLTRDLVINYYLAHKRYPKIKSERPNTSERILHFFNNSINLTNPVKLTELNRIPLTEWNTIYLEKNAEFDTVDNQLTLLKDKSLGLPRSKIYPVLIANTINFEHHSLGRVEDRRALLNYLLCPSFSNDFLRYLDSYSNDDPWGIAVLEYLVIKLTPKELEEKPDGRMFGASPAVERTRRIVQEFNTMRFLGRYVPDQLLTPDELTLTKKLYSFRKLSELYPDHVVFQVSFDFSKWNNSMRHESIDIPARRLLDSWYQTTIYGRTMEAYENSLVYYLDHHYSDFWDGQEGGIEGLNQATWTYVFLGGIKQALERLGVIFQVTVKGDDVRAAIAVPRQTIERQGIETMRDHIMEQLQQLCRDMGWTLNPQESFVSLSLICTSKQYQIHNTWLPASMKKMMKAESLANLVFPTTEDIVSSVFSTAHSACAQTTTVIPAFSTACVVAARVLYRDFFKLKPSSTELCMLLCWPQILGGPGALPLQTYLVRGENDMLSISISLMRHILVMDHPYLSPIAHKILSLSAESPPNMKQFLGDPYSIPLKVPPRANVVLKNLIRSNMVHWIKNSDLIFLLQSECRADEETLVSALTSMRPVCPKLITNIYENSPFYLREEIIAKFMSSSTIFAFFQKGKTRRLSPLRAHRKLRQVIAAAEARKAFWFTTIRLQQPDTTCLLGVDYDLWLNYKKVCSTQITQNVRDTLWDVPIRALTYPSLIDQNMLYAGEDLLNLHPNWDVRNIASQVTVHRAGAQYQTDDQSHHYAATQNVNPWLGAYTTSKLMLPALDNDIRSPVITKIMNLLMIKRTGYYLGLRFQQLVDRVLAGLTTLNLQALDVLMPEGQGGHIAHRVAINSFSLVTMPNVRPNIAQNVTINNESMLILKSDNRNRTINFAARNFYLIGLATMDLNFNTRFSNLENITYLAIYHNRYRDDGLYEICPYCCGVVDDEEIAISDISTIDLSKYAEYKLIGTSEAENRMLRANIGGAILGKVRRHLRNEYLDLHNIVNISIASARVIASEFANSMAIYRAAQSAQTRIIPRRDLIEVVSANWRGGTYLNPKFSVQVLRSLVPRVLYASVLQSCFQYYLQVLSADMDLDRAKLIPLIQRHLNPLSGVFARLTLAGVMGQLSRGCGEVGLLTDRLIWPHRAYSDPHTACMHFLLTHLDLFSQIVMGHVPQFAAIRHYMNMESDETILADLRDQYDTMRKIALIRMNRRGALGRPLGVIMEIADEYLPGNLVDEAEEDIFLQINAPGIAERILYTDVLQRCDNLNIPRVEGCMVLLRAITCYLLCYTMVEGEWVTFDMGNVLHVSQAFSILECHLHEPEVDLQLPDDPTLVIENNECLRWLRETYGVGCIRICHEMALRLHNAPWMDEHLFDAYLKLADDTRTWAALVGSRSLSSMTDEDVERVLRAQAVDMGFTSDDTVMVGMVPPEAMRGESNLLNHCRYEPDVHIGQEAGGQLILPHERDLQLFEQDLEQLRQIHFPQHHQALGVDISYYFQMSPCMSWTASRFLECLEVFNIHEFIEGWAADSLAVVIGDGGGGISKTLLTLYPTMRAIYCSRIIDPNTGDMVDDGSLTSPPYEFQESLCTRDTLDRLIWNGFYPGDITMTSVQVALISKINQMTQSPLLLISDAEFPILNYTHNALHFLSSFFRVAQSTIAQYTVILFRLLVSPDLILYQLLVYLKQRFLHFHLFKSTVSRAAHTEVYVLCSGLMGIARIDADILDILQQLKMCRYHIDSANYVLDHILRYTSSNKDRQTMGIYSGQQFMQYWGIVRRLRVTPRPLSLYLRQLRVHQSLHIRDVCDIIPALDQKLRDMYNEITSAWMEVTDPQGRYRNLRHVPHGQLRRRRIQAAPAVDISEVASGIRVLVASLVDIWVVMSINNVVQGVMQNCVNNCPDIICLVVYHVRAMWALSEIFREFELETVANQVCVTYRDIHVDIIGRIRTMLKQYMRLLGTRDYIQWVASGNRLEAEQIAQGFVTPIVVGNCCIARGEDVRRFWAQDHRDRNFLLSFLCDDTATVILQDIHHDDLETEFALQAYLNIYRGRQVQVQELEDDGRDNRDWWDIIVEEEQL